jgi:hypothetical protein
MSSGAIHSARLAPASRRTAISTVRSTLVTTSSGRPTSARQPAGDRPQAALFLNPQPRYYYCLQLRPDIFGNTPSSESRNSLARITSTTHSSCNDGCSLAECTIALYGPAMTTLPVETGHGRRMCWFGLATQQPVKPFFYLRAVTGALFAADFSPQRSPSSSAPIRRHDPPLPAIQDQGMPLLRSITMNTGPASK